MKCIKGKYQKDWLYIWLWWQNNESLHYIICLNIWEGSTLDNLSASHKE